MNPLVLPNDNGIRPAGKSNQCFYCDQEVGNAHISDCVILQRKVRVRYSFDIEIEMPHHWTEADILFNRNDGSWCADNAIQELEEYVNDTKNCHTGCLCSVFSCEVLEIPEAKPYRKNNKDKIVP